ncbi:MAG: TPM domain-containing protein [Candidatus Riflebacteria bacterium]|nr:TPM domain-containing protein [Candidatus Riflebacteria bacterium]
MFSLSSVYGQQLVASPSHPIQNGVSQIAKYVDDSAGLLLSETATAIASDCVEIEKVTNIRVLVKTLRVKNLNNSQALVDTFFSEWIRNINMDKRGILLFALLPEGAVQGKVHLRVGIGLKYLITKEMGEKILNQVILPNNLNNKDAAGFLEGVVAIRKMLLDELKREGAAVSLEGPQVFDLQKFLWASKEVLLTILIGLFLFYIIFFVERCPRCNSSLKVSSEILKEPGSKTLGLQRKIYSCERCGFSRRKKEPIYPSGKTGLMMRITGARRNVRIE